MSDSADPGSATGSRTSTTPRALIHKKILEAAAEMPEAPMEDVAGEVSGASTDLVERVLREYGDPAGAESGSGEQPASDGVSTSANGPATAGDVGTADAAPPDASQSADESSPDDASSAEGTPPPDAESSEVSGDAPTSGDDSASRATDDEQTGDEQSDDETVTDDPAVRDPEELSDKERAVLEVVAERPTATQQEVADELGVSRATVSKRASGIEGFDWQRRGAFVERLFDEDATLTRGSSDGATVSPDAIERSNARTDGDRRPAADSPEGPTGSADTAGVAARLDRVEDRLDRLESGETAASGGIADPALAHKVVHACMESDHVDEDEELRVVSAVLNGEPGD